MALAKPVSKEKLAQYCRENGIRWLATYNVEIVRRNVPGVNLYLLATFEEGHRVGWDIVKIEKELASLFGVPKADLRTLPELRDYYRDEVLAAAEVQFAA